MTNQTQTVLITGARAPIALEMARSFKLQGHRVIMSDSLSLTIARWSNCVDKYYLVAPPRYHLNLFIENIQEIIEKEKITDFIPTCEETIFVAMNKEKFNCKVWACNKELIINLHNKYYFSHFSNIQFPIPKTDLLPDFNDWEDSEKYVFKPCYSRFASAVIINKKIDSHYFQQSDKSKWIAQKKIDGIEICIYSIWDNGTLKAYAAYHPLYKAGKGAGVFFEPVKNDLVFEYVNYFGTNINYTGQLSFDVIIDKQGIPYFIECNPRGTSGAHLINTHLSEAFLENKLYVYQGKQDFCIKYAMAILHPFSFLKKRVRQSKDTIFQSNDVKPFFFQILSLLEITYIKFNSRIAWLEATTGDIEWNGNES